LNIQLNIYPLTIIEDVPGSFSAAERPIRTLVPGC